MRSYFLRLVLLFAGAALIPLIITSNRPLKRSSSHLRRHLQEAPSSSQPRITSDALQSPQQLVSMSNLSVQQNGQPVFAPHSTLVLNPPILFAAAASALQDTQLQPQPSQQQSTVQPQQPQLGISVPLQNPDCPVPNAAERSVQSPVWSASYPGSGAKLTWKLIRAITGIMTSDDHDHNGRVKSGTAVAVKTHWPSHTHAEIFQKHSLPRALLLTRNPLMALPSYHNFVYEQQNNLRNHSTRAPVEAWIAWRNTYFLQELQAWVDHQKYWIDNYHYQKQNLHLVAMEHLVSENKGIDTLRRMGDYLASGGSDIANSMVPPERYACIWEMFVSGNIPGERQRRKSQRSGGPKVYPFTGEQLDHMIQALRKLQDEYRRYPEFVGVLEEYLATIERQKSSVEEM